MVDILVIKVHCEGMNSLLIHLCYILYLAFAFAEPSMSVYRYICHHSVYCVATGQVKYAVGAPKLLQYTIQ